MFKNFTIFYNTKFIKKKQSVLVSGLNKFGEFVKSYSFLNSFSEKFHKTFQTFIITVNILFFENS